MIQALYVAAVARLPRPGRPPAPRSHQRLVTRTQHDAVRRWLPAALWAAGLLTATSWPNPHVPDVRAGDKVVHVGLYAGLAWLCTRALLAGDRRPSPLWVVVAVAAFGAVDEWHQRFIPGRSTSAADWAADAAGAAAGALAATLSARRTAGALRA